MNIIRKFVNWLKGLFKAALAFFSISKLGRKKQSAAPKKAEDVSTDNPPDTIQPSQEPDTIQPSQEPGRLELLKGPVTNETIGKNNILIFPSNVSQHHINSEDKTFQPTLSAKDWGGGLALAARKANKDDIMTIGIPTQIDLARKVDPALTNDKTKFKLGLREDFTSDEFKKLCGQSILLIWCAIGSGKTVKLPVREYNSKGEFFKKPLPDTVSEERKSRGLEPSFGGGNNSTKSPELFSYYLTAISDVLTWQKAGSDPEKIPRLPNIMGDEIKGIMTPQEAFNLGKTNPSEDQMITRLKEDTTPNKITLRPQ